jgi:hypothetical protein
VATPTDAPPYPHAWVTGPGARRSRVTGLKWRTLAVWATYDDPDIRARYEDAFSQAGEPDRQRAGPTLHGLFGRTSGTVEDFDYSPAMVEAGEGGLVWNEETLSEFLADPDAFVPGNQMPFPGLDSEQEIADVIEYLGQYSE